MTQDQKLIFVTGAPGSAWSMISNRLKKAFESFDKSDETPDRKYQIPDHHKSQYQVSDPSWVGHTHMGSYFGPYHEFGEGFDNIQANYTRETFLEECSKPYIDPSKPNKIIRSHWFAYNLDWIWDNCKGEKMFLIWREAEAARDWWYNMGGWEINYPIYTWYQNPERMWEKIQEETSLLWDFAQRKNITLVDYDDDEYVINKWVSETGETRKEQKYKATPLFKDKIKVALVDIT